MWSTVGASVYGLGVVDIRLLLGVLKLAGLVTVPGSVGAHPEQLLAIGVRGTGLVAVGALVGVGGLLVVGHRYRLGHGGGVVKPCAKGNDLVTALDKPKSTPYILRGQKQYVKSLLGKAKPYTNGIGFCCQ